MSEYDDLLDDVLDDVARPGPVIAPSEITSNREEAVGEKSRSAGKASPGRGASVRKRKSAGASKAPNPVAEEVPAETQQAKADTKLTPTSPQEPARRGMSRQLERSGRCPMYAPRGTVCKTCGKVHPL